MRNRTLLEEVTILVRRGKRASPISREIVITRKKSISIGTKGAKVESRELVVVLMALGVRI